MTRIVAILPLTFCLTASLSASGMSRQAHATGAPPQAASPESATFPRSLVGRWRAPVERIPLSDDSSWGRGVTAVRTTELQFGPTGVGTITVTRTVMNRAGRVLPGSRVIDTAEFRLGSLEQPAGLRPRYTTTIVTGERRYPDPPVVRTSLDGLRIDVFPPEADSTAMEIRFETFAGDGTFSDTLRRLL
jgi:hypothetical protein